MVQVVSEYVHGQSRHADVHLVADMALLGIVAVQASVGLPVSREIAARRIMFPTVTASVLRFLASLLQPILRSPVCYRQLGVGGRVGVVGVVGAGVVLVDHVGLGQGVRLGGLQPGASKGVGRV